MKKFFVTIILIAFIFSNYVYAQGWRANEMEVRVEISNPNIAQALSNLNLVGDYSADHA